MNTRKGLLCKSFELIAARDVSQLADCLDLYLTYALTGDVELLANLLKRVAASVLKTVTQPDNFRFTLGKCIKHL